jgi:hypothetical protein
MRNYLSFGGGVNSVALYLLMQDLGVEFEAVFVDHGGDWPETYAYVDYFIATGRPITVLKPDVEGCDTLLAYCDKYKMLPNRMQRWCTDKFKVRVVYRYVETPCFMHLGIDSGETRRATLNSNKGVENRYLLIEHGIDRDGCKKLITGQGLKMPMKSGCYFCPFQRVAQWRSLRKIHPELFCIVQRLEKEGNEKRHGNGLEPWNILGPGRELAKVIGGRDKQAALPGMEHMEYPPCQCGL